MVLIFVVVTPRNYLLFACHVINETAQLGQGYRYLKYWQYVQHSFSLSSRTNGGGSWGGREAKSKNVPPTGKQVVTETMQQAIKADVPLPASPATPPKA